MPIQSRMILWMSLLGLILPTSTWANFNYRGIVAGERAMGMGGAYIALSNSSEGGIYNPAGLAFVSHDSLSIAGNLYRVTRGERKEAIVLSGSTKDLPQDAFSSVPQIAAFAKRFRLPWDKADTKLNTVSLNVVVLSQNELTGRVKFDLPEGTAGGTRSLFTQTLLIGPSYARRISERLSLGFTVGYFITKTENVGFLSEDSPTTFSQAFAHEITNVGGLLGLLGVRYSPLPNFWLGLTYQTPTLRLHSSGSYFRSIGITDRSDNTLQSSNDDYENLKPRSEIPQRVGLGLAYVKGKNWGISGDVLFHMPNDYASIDGAAANIHQQLTVNGSLGGEVYFTPKYALRAGLFTNLSSAPDLQSGTTGQPDQVDHFGMTLSGSLEAKNSTLTIGGVVTLGDGNGVDNLGNIISVVEQSYAIVLSGSYKF